MNQLGAIVDRFVTRDRYFTRIAFILFISDVISRTWRFLKSRTGAKALLPIRTKPQNGCQNFYSYQVAEWEWNGDDEKMFFCNNCWRRHMNQRCSLSLRSVSKQTNTARAKHKAASAKYTFWINNSISRFYQNGSPTLSIFGLVFVLWLGFQRWDGTGSLRFSPVLSGSLRLSPVLFGSLRF